MNVVTHPTVANGQDSSSPKPRGQSSIKFPYAALDDAEALAVRLHQAGGEASPDQLAAWLQHKTVNSGAFRNKVSASKLFGLVETGQGNIVLTQLGHRIADASNRDAARVEAFLGVPLYHQIYETYKGGLLPPDSGLELEMTRLGVTASQKQSARQVFQRSAEHAGFFASGRNRLVPPATGNVVVDDLKPRVDPQAPPVTQFTSTKLPKIIEGILDEAPWGQSWNEEELVEWIELLRRAARVHFKLPSGKAGP